MNNDYLNTALSTDRIGELAKRIAAWIVGGLILHWFFEFSEIAAIVAIIAIDLFALSPIAFLREKNAYSQEILDEMQSTIERLTEIGGKNYDLATSRKVSLELAEKKIGELAAKCEQLSQENHQIANQYSEILSRYNSLEFAHQSLTEKNRSLSEENKSLTEKNRSLTEENKSLKFAESSLSEKMQSLTEENKSLKFAHKSLTNRLNALHGVLKRQNLTETNPDSL
jgi:chromosome segregation ATPase